MATYREPQVTSPLQHVTNIARCDLLRTLTRLNLSRVDEVTVLTALIADLEQMRDRRARWAVQETDVSYAEMGRRLGVSSSYARRVLKPYRDAA